MEITRKNIGNEITQYKLLNASLASVFELGYATALWRSPESNQKHQIIDMSPEIEITEEQLEDLQPGFLFSKFTGSEKYYIKAHLHLEVDGMGSSLSSNTRDYSSEKYSDLLQRNISKDVVSGFTINHEAKPVNTSHSHYIDYIKNGMEQISNGEFLKVVPARSKVIDIPEGFNIIQFFLDLCEQYPNAFISLVSVPGHGTWIGASPESLISMDSKGIFQTVSLAGTQSYDPEKELYDMPWTQKEIEEQALVTRYVIDCFKKIRLREFEEHGPKTVKAGNLCHLRTDFKVNTLETNFKDLGSVMLELLHPTSAVCGMPMKNALDFIQKYEGFDREFFSGFLGPVNINEEIHLFVNLRCIQLLEKQAILYAGAGVTAYSIPENEWKETELKYNTMANLF